MGYRIVLCETCGFFKIDIKNNDICPVCNNKITVINMSAKEFMNMNDTEEEQYALKYVGHDFDLDLKHKRMDYCAELRKNNKIDFKPSPKCPTCQSTNVQKIGTLERGASVAMFGLFSKKINKSFKCNDCGHTW